MEHCYGKKTPLSFLALWILFSWYCGWIPRASVLYLLSYFPLAWLLSPGPHASTPSSKPYNYLILFTATTGLIHPLVPSTASTPLPLQKTDLPWTLGHLRSKSGEQNWNSQALGRNLYCEKYQRICVFTDFNYFWVNWTRLFLCFGLLVFHSA